MHMLQGWLVQRQGSELQAAVMKCRLHNTVKDSLNLQFNKTFRIVDSGAFMDMIVRESTACKELVGTRIGEIWNKE